MQLLEMAGRCAQEAANKINVHMNFEESQKDSRRPQMQSALTYPHTHTHLLPSCRLACVCVSQKFMLVLKFSACAGPGPGLGPGLGKKFCNRNLSNSSCKNVQHSHKLNNNFLSEFSSSFLRFLSFFMLVYFVSFLPSFAVVNFMCVCARVCVCGRFLVDSVGAYVGGGGVSSPAYVNCQLAKVAQ